MTGSGHVERHRAASEGIEQLFREVGRLVRVLEAGEDLHVPVEPGELVAVPVVDLEPGGPAVPAGAKTQDRSLRHRLGQARAPGTEPDEIATRQVDVVKPFGPALGHEGDPCGPRGESGLPIGSRQARVADEPVSQPVDHAILAEQVIGQVCPVEDGRGVVIDLRHPDLAQMPGRKCHVGRERVGGKQAVPEGFFRNERRPRPGPQRRGRLRAQ